VTCLWLIYPLLRIVDDEILVDLGSVIEGNTEEERATYRAGLRDVITGMRQAKVSDFEQVASAIIDYRRRFLKDETRVLTM